MNASFEFTARFTLFFGRSCSTGSDRKQKLYVLTAAWHCTEVASDAPFVSLDIFYELQYSGNTAILQWKYC